ncbi:2-dehydro-3-deoxygalactonokinase [Cnuella takakiae]|uniref:2-dehydro-3-deoxygalactonokinase n=1 Tax=Cnuella takakiae TaxID=1302690 RepID=A0A1M5A1S0_9BACT|nr:2-dehydro-3-deoxygalactonokinase [Cnuella takakiae]OLY92140.1 hypothetical protein BUE76_09705 [Cnuella takakiae]SHF23772.1 2-dehydro-3-deoxygalactonokinase [Cnuella takakiae]
MHHHSGHFLSCDWGTSSFRLRLVALPHLQVAATYNSYEGIAATWRAWQESGGKRILFYQRVVQKGIEALAQTAGRSLAGLPLVLSGMASASIGMMELPYAALPFPLDGSAALVQHQPATEVFPYPAWLLSGVRSVTDVMRGEEVQLLGALGADSGEDQLCIIPGTHSKHIQVQQGVLTNFATFMTGEFFALLSQQSILAASVEKGDSWQAHTAAFADGLHTGSQRNLLQVCFGVRTNQLFGKWGKTENYQYLSGLLLGAELAALKELPYQNLSLIGNSVQQELYRFALQTLFPETPIQVFDVDEALVAGQYRVWQQHAERLV